MKLSNILKNKQLILDGAMGTMLPRVSGETEEDKVRLCYEKYVHFKKL